MTTATQVDDLHRLLLRLSGRAPDALVCRARQWLADGRVSDAADVLSFARLAGFGAAVNEPPPYVMGPVGPDVAERIPYCLDLTVERAGPGGSDHLDAVAVRHASLLGARALWRSWRYPAVSAPWPLPKRMYLVWAPAGEIAVAAGLQAVLIADGEDDPLVEAFTEAADLPTHQRQALTRSSLLWSGTPAATPRITPTFDALDGRGWPTFVDDRLILAGDEAAKVVAYLSAGVLLLATPELTADVLDPGQPVVPMGVRGDGTWLWSEAATYYARAYGIAPDLRLLDAIRAASYGPPTVDIVALHRSVSLIFAAVHDADQVGAEVTAPH